MTQITDTAQTITDTAQTKTPEVLQRHHAQAGDQSILQRGVPRKGGRQGESASATSKCSSFDEDDLLGEVFLWIYLHLSPKWLDNSPRTVRFIDHNGVPGFYTFALTAHLRDGRRLAIAVEDERFASPESREAYFQSIRHLIPKWFADGIAVFTQRGLACAEYF